MKSTSNDEQHKDKDYTQLDISVSFTLIDFKSNAFYHQLGKNWTPLVRYCHNPQLPKSKLQNA